MHRCTDGSCPQLRLGWLACRASKAALNIINKALCIDLAEQQVQCVLLHPGYVKTDMTGGRRAWAAVHSMPVMAVHDTAMPWSAVAQCVRSSQAGQGLK